MNEKHTKEPWHSADGIRDNVGDHIANSRGHNERIVACVNACAGIPIAALEDGVIPEMVELAEALVRANLIILCNGALSEEELADAKSILAKLDTPEAPEAIEDDVAESVGYCGMAGKIETQI